MNEVYIVNGCRTPIGSFKKGLSSFSASQLGGLVIKETINRVSRSDIRVDEVLMGQVCQANCGQHPARQSALLADLPVTVSCTTINKVCASGMKSIIFGSQSIICGDNNVVIAGGQESMSNIPFYLPRKEPSYGGSNLIDGIVRDGLTDAFCHCHMGIYADDHASSASIDRKSQDDFAKLSYERSLDALNKGVFEKEIVPVTVIDKNGDITISEDEEIKRVQFDKIVSLKPVFKSNGTITAANASSLNDGAACVMLASQFAVNKFELKPVAKVIGFADAAVEPKDFIGAPVDAIDKLLKKYELTHSDIDLWEINEAFSVAILASLQRMPEVGIDRVNIHGGAVSLGHPLGMSGARIVLHLALNLQPGQRGIAAICNGGGGASAILIEGC